MLFTLETVLYHYSTTEFEMWKCLSSKNLALFTDYQCLIEPLYLRKKQEARLHLDTNSW